MKRVKQICIDILVDEEKDGCELAEQIAKDLEAEGNIVLGSSFQDDLTELYKRDYPNDYPELFENSKDNMDCVYPEYNMIGG